MSHGKLKRHNTNAYIIYVMLGATVPLSKIRVLPTVKFRLIFGHIDISTFSVVLLKLYGAINLLLVVQFLMKSSLLEYSSIR